MDSQGNCFAWLKANWKETSAVLVALIGLITVLVGKLGRKSKDANTPASHTPPGRIVTKASGGNAVTNTGSGSVSIIGPASPPKGGKAK
jgi:hypothetical protein